MSEQWWTGDDWNALATAINAASRECRSKAQAALDALTPTVERIVAERTAELREDVEEYAPLLTRQGDLLTRTVNAIKGDPPELTTWSHHDIPELAAELKANAERQAGLLGLLRVMAGGITGGKWVVDVIDRYAPEIGDLGKAECEHDPAYSRSECGQCGQQEVHCSKCSIQMCDCYEIERGRE